MACDETVAADSGFRIELIQQSDYRLTARCDRVIELFDGRIEREGLLSSSGRSESVAL